MVTLYLYYSCDQRSHFLRNGLLADLKIDFMYINGKKLIGDLFRIYPLSLISLTLSEKAEQTFEGVNNGLSDDEFSDNSVTLDQTINGVNNVIIQRTITYLVFLFFFFFKSQSFVLSTFLLCSFCFKSKFLSLSLLFFSSPLCSFCLNS